jgi:hypothetical protein
MGKDFCHSPKHGREVTQGKALEMLAGGLCGAEHSFGSYPIFSSRNHCLLCQPAFAKRCCRC